MTDQQQPQPTPDDGYPEAIITGMDQLVQIFLNGFASGITSILLTCGVDEDLADAQAHAHTSSLRKSDELRAEVIRQIRETLAGTDSGPRMYRHDLDGRVMP